MGTTNQQTKQEKPVLNMFYQNNKIQEQTSFYPIKENITQHEALTIIHTFIEETEYTPTLISFYTPINSYHIHYPSLKITQTQNPLRLSYNPNNYSHNNKQNNINNNIINIGTTGHYNTYNINIDILIKYHDIAITLPQNMPTHNKKYLIEILNQIIQKQNM